MFGVHRHLLWLIGAAVFFVNPFFACVGDDFEFGAMEMRGAIEGTWDLTFSLEGQQQNVTIAIKQGTQGATAQAAPSASSGLIRSAAACGDRTLVRSAGACVTVTGMPLDVSFIAGDEVFRSSPMQGNFMVAGLKFEFGDLGLQIGAKRVAGRMSPAGEASELMVFFGAGGETATLVRVAP